ncbi:MAG: PaaI family thioesterase [Candidatus Eremiobacteraeota bacterium]|nr:PaaI family thioesterase [Candidatus Eremiobacteraeota bacterium]
MRFEPAGDGTVVASVTVNEEFQGWKGVAHGGIAMALLDEAMAHAALTAGHRGVTASMTTRFRKAVPVAQALTVSASIARIRRNVLFVTAQLRDRDAHVLAEAEGSFVVRR